MLRYREHIMPLEWQFFVSLFISSNSENTSIYFEIPVCYVLDSIVFVVVLIRRLFFSLFMWNVCNVGTLPSSVRRNVVLNNMDRFMKLAYTHTHTFNHFVELSKIVVLLHGTNWRWNQNANSSLNIIANKNITNEISEIANNMNIFRE